MGKFGCGLFKGGGLYCVSVDAVLYICMYCTMCLHIHVLYFRSWIDYKSVNFIFLNYGGKHKDE